MASIEPEDLAALIASMIERVDARDKQVVAIEPLPEWLPFFGQGSVGMLAPPDGLEPPIPTQRPGLVSRGRMMPFPCPLGRHEPWSGREG